MSSVTPADNSVVYMRQKIRRLTASASESVLSTSDIDQYINRKGGHERLDKHYVKYAGERIEKWHCIPGKRYTVPMGLVKEVNEMKLPPKRSGLVSLDGQELNKNGAPIEADQEADWEHRFVPTKY